SSGTTRAPFLLDMARDLSVSMPLVANLVSMTATAWAVSSAVGGALSDLFGRRVLLVGSLIGLAVVTAAQAFAYSFLWVAVFATAGGFFCGIYTSVSFAEVSARVEDRQRGRALGSVMSGQSLTLVVGVPMAAWIGALIGWRGWHICLGGFALAASLGLFASVAGGAGAATRAVARPTMLSALS